MSVPSPRGPARPARLRRGLWVAVAACVIALGVWGAVAAWDEWKVRGEARSAHAALDARQYDQARSSIARWLTARPRSAEAHFLQARLAFAEGRSRESFEALKKAEQLGYPERECNRLRGFVLVRSGRYDEAEPLLSRVLAATKEPDPETAEALTRALLQTYKLGQAEAVIRRWVRDAPNDARPYLWWTEIDRRSDVEPSVAIGHYQEALKRDPNLDEARLGLADALRAAHRPAEAAEAYAAYIARKPDDLAGHLGAARVALELGDEAGASKHLARALAISPDDPNALRTQAEVDLLRGDAPAALAHLDRAIRREPLDAELAYRRTLVLARLGRSDEAKAEEARRARLVADQDRLLKIRERLVQEPNNLELRVLIARWMFEHDQNDEAIRWCQTVLAQRSGHPEACRLLSEVYSRRGDAGLANYYRLMTGAEPVRRSKP